MGTILPTLYESVDAVSPATMSFSLRDGHATLPFICPNSGIITGLQSYLPQILGGISTKSAGGMIQRTMPLAHPQAPWLFASSVGPIRGLGTPTQANPAAAIEVPPFGQALLYENYEVTVEFTPRPYAVLQDSSIVTQLKQDWFDENNANIQSTFSPEYLRWTYWQTVSANEWVKAQQGNMNFRTQSGSKPGGNTPVPFMDMPKLRLPDQIIKFKWLEVPYRYITSSKSYIARYVNRINQLAFMDWSPGQLFYLNYNATPYTPPAPAFTSWLQGTSAAEKWCDIEFTFLLTTRTATDVPTPTNLNYVAAGFNLAPWHQTRKFYYATTVGSPDTDTTQWVPMWLSFPFQLLFTDPDV